MNWKEYKVANKPDDILMNDFKLLVQEYRNINTKKESELVSIENVIKYAKLIIGKILNRGVVTFNINKMSEDSLELFKECLVRLITKKQFINSPYSEAIWLSKIVDILECNKDFKILCSRNLAFGFIRCNEDKIREFIKFDTPYILNKDIKSCMPLDFDLSKLNDDQIIELHNEVHDEARIYSTETGNPPKKVLVNKHTYIIKEMKSRDLIHGEWVELDKLSSKSIVNNVFVKEVLDKWQGSTSIRNPVLSIKGDACISGLDKRLHLCLNWPEFDTKSIKVLETIMKQVLPEKIRGKIDFIPDNNGDDVEDNYIPIAELQIKMIPVGERQLLRLKQGTFLKERVNGKM